MSKDEAWGYIQDSWWFSHSEGCIGNCNCRELLEQIKGVLNV